MGSICTASPATTTTTQTPNPIVAQAFADLNSRATALSQLPYVPYGGQLVAGVTPDQQESINRIMNAYGTASPYLDTAAAYGRAGAAPITNEMIQPLMSPYTQDVVNATLGNLREQYGQTLSGIKGNAIAQNAMGGSREAVAEAEASRQFNLSAAPTIAGLYNQAYNQAANLAQGNLARQAQAGYFFGNLGPVAQSTLLSAGQAGLGAGTLEQQTQQNALNAAYQQFLQQQAFPYQQLGWYAGTTSPFLSAFGPTVTQTQTPSTPSFLQSGLGIGTVLGGIFGGGSKAAGGRVSPYQFGGAVGSPYGGIGKSSPYSLTGATSYIPSVDIKPLNFSIPKMPGERGGGGGSDNSIFGQSPESLAKMGKNLGNLGSKAWDWMTPSGSGELGAPAADIDAFVGPSLGDAGPSLAQLGLGEGPAAAEGAGSMFAGLGGIGEGIGSALAGLGEFAPLLLFAKRGGRIGTGDSFLDTVHAMHGTLRKLQFGGDVEDDYETLAPGPAVLRPGREFIRGGESAPIGLVPDRLAESRARFIDETNDPAVRNRLMRLTEAEVGGQGPAAANAFMESVFNRASARGQPLRYAMNDPGYYPRVSLVGREPTARDMYDERLSDVLGGSNLSRYATGNASGTVGFAGGPQTYAPGTGERFGIEGSDRPWATAMALNRPDDDESPFANTPEQRGITRALAFRGPAGGGGGDEEPVVRRPDVGAPYRDVAGNLRWPVPRPEVQGNGPISWLANKLGASESDTRLGLISAGLGMIAGNPRGNASGITGTLAGVAQGAQGGLNTLMAGRQLTQQLMEQQQQQRIQQQQNNIQQQRANQEAYHAPIISPLGNFAVSLPKNPEIDKPVYYKINPDGTIDTSSKSSTAPAGAVAKPTIWDGTPANSPIAPVGGTVMQAPVEDMTGPVKVEGTAEVSPNTTRAYFDPKSRPGGIQQAGRDRLEANKQAMPARSVVSRATSMTHTLDVLDNFIERIRKAGHPELAEFFEPGPYGAVRYDAIVKYNAVAPSLGLPVVPKDVIANAQLLSKDSLMAGFANITGEGMSAREAQSVIQAAISATPSLNNPIATNRLLSAMMKANAQWKIDQQKFLEDFMGKNGGFSLNWREQFDKKFPVQRYLANAIVETLPEAARKEMNANVGELRKLRDVALKNPDDPDAAANFNKARSKFNAGYGGLANYFAFGAL